MSIATGQATVKALAVTTAIAAMYYCHSSGQNCTKCHLGDQCWANLGASKGSHPLCRAGVPSSREVVQPGTLVASSPPLSPAQIAKVVLAFSLLLPHPLDPSLPRPFPQPRSTQR